MSFYVYRRDDLMAQLITVVVTLAVEGEIEAALQKWQQHMAANKRCGCGNDTFDPVNCSYCLTGRLLHLELLHADSSANVDCLKTGRAISAVSAYVQKKRAAVPNGFTSPATHEAESRT
ncbi:MAG: hypothetical protein NUV50_14220 [Rhodospirillales bacterium]|nr:hypothetical protein [Rhodospirillales bacterium]